MPLKPRPDRPIDPISLDVIRAVTGIAGELGLETFMVGATARIILLENVFGLPPSRATRDIDFAFAVESWEQFQTLKQRLASKASFTQLERAAQRLIFKPEGWAAADFKDTLLRCEIGGDSWLQDGSSAGNSRLKRSSWSPSAA